MRQISPLRLIIILLSSIGLVLVILYIIILYSNFYPKGEGILVYLPKNYDKNYIIIIYDQKGGAKKERKNDKRVFRIPESGVFFTQYNMQREWVKYKFYYVDGNGIKLKEIKYNDYQIKLKPNEVYIMESFSSFNETEGYESEHIIIGKPDIIGENNSLLPLTKTRNVLDSIVVSKGWKK